MRKTLFPAAAVLTCLVFASPAAAQGGTSLAFVLPHGTE